MKTPIIQFGTSRFLQAHADLFISEAMRQGQEAGPVTVVQTSGSADRAGRLAAFDGRPLPIIVRGLENGVSVDRTEYTTCLVRGLSTAIDWGETERIFVEEAEHVISNTGDTGYAIPDGEFISDAVPTSFPAKLTKLLFARWSAGGAPLTILPCELIPNNGIVLRDLCLEIARRSNVPEAFITWLGERCIWANTLVDRIVSEPLEPAGAIAEPYALWAIEKQDGLALPFTHPSIQFVDDLSVIERLKLFILNLGHTCLAEWWITGNRPGDENVRQILEDKAIAADLDAILDDEVLPILEAAGIEEAPAYRETVMGRFKNPFLDHRLSEIAKNHTEKKRRRLGGILDLAAEVYLDPDFPKLAAIRDSGVSGSV